MTHMTAQKTGKGECPMNRPALLLKYAPSLKFLDNGLFRFSQPAALNDAYEALPGLMINTYSNEDIATAKARSVRDGLHGISDKKLAALFLMPSGRRMDEKSFPGLWPFHQPALRNEPFESLDEYDKAIAERAVEMAKALANRTIGIFSLTESYHETMWAHYADDNRGVCITFDPQHAYFAANRPERILYTDEPVKVTINQGQVRFCGYCVDKKSILRGELDFVPRELFLRKQIPWQYEKEWRITKFLCDATEISASSDSMGQAVCLFEIPTRAISGITFGWRADDTSIQQALRVIEKDPRWNHLWVRRRARSLTDVIEEVVRG
jgi:hypothetical protein